MRGGDLDWRNGRHGAYVWYASDELEDVLREAFGMFMVENGLGIRVFPSIGRMEREVLGTVQGLLSGDEETAVRDKVAAYRDQMRSYARAISLMYKLPPERITTRLVMLATGRVETVEFGP